MKVTKKIKRWPRTPSEIERGEEPKFVHIFKIEHSSDRAMEEWLQRTSFFRWFEVTPDVSNIDYMWGDFDGDNWKVMRVMFDDEGIAMQFYFEFLDGH